MAALLQMCIAVYQVSQERCVSLKLRAHIYRERDRRDSNEIKALNRAKRI